MAILHLSAIYLKVFYASGRNCALHKNRENEKSVLYLTYKIICGRQRLYALRL